MIQRSLVGMVSWRVFFTYKTRNLTTNLGIGRVTGAAFSYKLALHCAVPFPQNLLLPVKDLEPI